MRMNKLPLSKRVQILAMLCEGSSMRSISRVAGVSLNTVSKLLIEAGETCLALHDKTVRNVKASRIQCDEIWSFYHAKQRMWQRQKPHRKIDELALSPAKRGLYRKRGRS